MNEEKRKLLLCMPFNELMRLANESPDADCECSVDCDCEPGGCDLKTGIYLHPYDALEFLNSLETALLETLDKASLLK